MFFFVFVLLFLFFLRGESAGIIASSSRSNTRKVKLKDTREHLYNKERGGGGHFCIDLSMIDKCFSSYSPRIFQNIKSLLNLIIVSFALVIFVSKSFQGLSTYFSFVFLVILSPSNNDNTNVSI